MRFERERPPEQNDRYTENHMRAEGIWGLVTERKTMLVDAVEPTADGLIRGRITHSEKIVDDGWTVEYSDMPEGETLVPFEDVSTPDRARIVVGAELELQWGRGPGYTFFRVVVRRSASDTQSPRATGRAK